MPPPDGTQPVTATGGFSSWVSDRAAPMMSTNAGAEPIAFQGWRNFKEAFAPELVARAVRETEAHSGRKVSHIFDPFGGSGTTALASQFLGITPTTIELNPYLADLIEAKLTQYDFDDVATTYLQVISAQRDPVQSVPFPGSPATFVEPGINEKFLFHADVAQRLATLHHRIRSYAGSVAVKRLLSVLLISCAVEVSNAVVSGKGRRYRRRWRENPCSAEDVDYAFRFRVEQALYDIRRHSKRPESGFVLLRGDARELSGSVNNTDLCIFSPPYPNSFDYTDVYNIELWTGGYLRDNADNRALRNRTIRSHVQIARDFSRTMSHSPILDGVISKLNERRKELWSIHIPAMIGAYFDDMLSVIRQVRSGLNPGGRIYMVVGDSRYAGVDIPVAPILAELAALDGLALMVSEPFRSMRASPQQGGRAELPETLVVLSG